MDPSECPSGYYTDRAFRFAALTECSTAIWVYWTCTMLICFLRFLCFFKKLENYLKYGPLIKTSNKIPISLITHLFAAIMYTVVSVVVGINAGNVDNGISFSVYSLAYITFIVNYTILLYRTVRLGQRLIPKSLDSQQSPMRELLFLSKFNTIGILFFCLQTLAAGISCIVLIIISPITPSQVITLGVIGFASKGIFQYLCIVGIVMQFERCIRALNSFKSQMSFNPALGEREVQLARTISIMRQRQVTIFIIGVSVSLIYLLFSGEVIPWTWAWIIVGTAGPETLGNLILEFCFTGNKKQHSSQGSFILRTQRNTPREDTHAPPNNNNEDDGFDDIHSSEGDLTHHLHHHQPVKTGPIGKRFRRKPKPAIDLTKVTEEPTYISQSIPISSLISVVELPTTDSVESTDPGMQQSNETRSSQEKF